MYRDLLHVWYLLFAVGALFQLFLGAMNGASYAGFGVLLFILAVIHVVTALLLLAARRTGSVALFGVA